MFVSSARGTEERIGHGLDAALAAAERARLKFAGVTADPAAVAADHAYWTDVQQAWAVDRTILNLENGGLQPAPAIVNQAFIKHWLYANEAPSYTNARILWPQVEDIRARLAQAFGCDTEEMAITRNTTEGFLAVAMGIKLASGDEVLTTTHDYHRFRNAFLQRQNREGVMLRTVQLPVPVEDDNIVVQRFEEAITPPHAGHLAVPHVPTDGADHADSRCRADGPQAWHPGDRRWGTWVCPHPGPARRAGV
jgi:DNA-binding transcriptional MocR family regulator